MGNSKNANRKAIEMGNAKMLAAWKQGVALSSADGKRPNMVAIRQASGGSASEAERLRKYRAMSQRITEPELRRITAWCLEFERAWGPTFLCVLSRIGQKKIRQRIAKDAIEQRLGLVELKRMVRIEKGSPDSIKSPTTRVGRRRSLDWTQPTNVLDEIHQVCRVFLTFANDIRRVTEERPKNSAVVKLLLKMKPRVDKAEEAIKRLQLDCDAVLKPRRKVAR
jgi:hypothetical protein